MTTVKACISLYLNLRLTNRGAQNSFFLNFSLSFSFPFFTLPQSPQTTPSSFSAPVPLYQKSTQTQLKIHFVWPKSEGVCAMGLLHSALKLVLWRRMGYYYLPATHPAIKTSGATSPQRSAAALPPFLSLSRSSYEPHTTVSLTLNSTLCYTDRPKNHTLLSSVALLLLLSIGYSSLGVFCFLFKCIFVNGHPWPVWGACEWTDFLAGWLIDRLAKREAAAFQLKRAMLWGQVRSKRAS